MKVVIVTNTREAVSLMPQVKFDLIRATLAPVDVSCMFVEDKKDFSLLDNISQNDIVLVETKDAETIHQIAIRGLRHTGETPTAVNFDSDKVYLRKAIKGKIPMPRLYESLDEIEDGKQYFVKPLILEDSIGIDSHSLCKSKDEVEERVNYIKEIFGKPAIVEDYVDGYDVTVGIINCGDSFIVKAVRIDSLLEGVPFQSEQVKTKDLRDFYDMDELNPKLSETLKNMAIGAFLSIGAVNYARLDFRVSEGGQPYLIEVNLYPGLKDTGAMYRAVKFTGMSYRDFLYRVLNTAHRRLI